MLPFQALKKEQAKAVEKASAEKKKISDLQDERKIHSDEIIRVNNNIVSLIENALQTRSDRGTTNTKNEFSTLTLPQNFWKDKGDQLLKGVLAFL